MAKFLTIKKSTEQDSAYGQSKSGAKGTHKLIAKAPAYTGRNSRVNYVDAVSADDSSVKARATITQLGVTVNKFKSNNTSSESKTAPAAGGAVTTTIVTNLQKLKIVEAGTSDCTLVVKYNNAAITPTGNVYTIPGDPGANGQVEVTIAVTVPNNPYAEQVNHTIDISAEAGGNSISLGIVQTSANPTISLTPTTAQIAAAGGTTELTLQVNDDWTATVADA